MKKLLFVFLPFYIFGADDTQNKKLNQKPANKIMLVQVPKSSLEAIRTDLAVQLTMAREHKDQHQIHKLQKQLAKTEKKIKNFELEWLKFRKRQIITQQLDTNVQEKIREIDQLIKERSNGNGKLAQKQAKHA